MSLTFDPLTSVTYSTDFCKFYGVVPANTQSFQYVSTGGHFRISTLPQRDVLDVIANDPVEVGHLCGPYDVSLAACLERVWRSIGIVFNGKAQVGTCALISSSLALIPSHCIEGLDVRGLEVSFGCVQKDRQVFQGRFYKIQHVIESDPLFDYAIVRIEGIPGKEHGYLPIHPEAEAYVDPALLHYPLSKPLKVSVHRFVQTHNYTALLSTFHDSDYGSSGGAYISPSGIFVAMHLGSARELNGLNLTRLALPIKEIINNNPNGILNRLAYGKLDPNEVYHDSYLGCPTYYLTPYLRNFIDFETFFRQRLTSDGDYRLRDPATDLPAVYIDSHQKKHATNWPSKYQGAPGDRFDKTVTLDDLIFLGEHILKNCQDLPKMANINYLKLTVPSE